MLKMIKYKAFVLILLVVSLSACNDLVNEVKKMKIQTITPNDYHYVLDSKNRRGFVDQKNQPMTGHYIVVKDSLPIEEFELEDGYLNGEYLFYNLTGTIVSRESYINSIKHGMQYTYHNSGDVASEVNFSHGVRDGDEVHYAPNHDITFRKTTQAGVEYAYRYENGKLITAEFDKNFDGAIFEMFVKYDHFENVEIIFGKLKDEAGRAFNVYDRDYNLIERIDPEINPERAFYYAQYFR